MIYSKDRKNYVYSRTVTHTEFKLNFKQNIWKQHRNHIKGYITNVQGHFFDINKYKTCTKKWKSLTIFDYLPERGLKIDYAILIMF